MSLTGMLAKEASKVLKFLLMRGEAVFELARQFVLLNRLRRTDVALVLATLYAEQCLSSDPSNAAWATWSEATFTQ